MESSYKIVSIIYGIMNQAACTYMFSASITAIIKHDDLYRVVMWGGSAKIENHDKLYVEPVTDLF